MGKRLGTGDLAWCLGLLFALSVWCFLGLFTFHVLTLRTSFKPLLNFSSNEHACHD